MQLAQRPGFELAPGAQHVEAYQTQQDAAYDYRDQRCDVSNAVNQIGLSDQHAAAGEQGAEGEGKGTENDKDADFLWRQTLAAVGPVTHDCA